MPPLQPNQPMNETLAPAPRKARRVVVTHLGVEGTGINKKSARIDAERQILEFFQEGFDTFLLHLPKYPDLLCVISRDSTNRPSNWGYRFYQLNDLKAAVTRHDTCTSGLSNRETAISAARRHAAQIVMAIDDDERTGCEFLESRSDISTHLGYLAWQRDYRRLVATGMSENDAHDKAQRDMALVATLVAKWLPGQANG